LLIADLLIIEQMSLINKSAISLQQSAMGAVVSKGQ